MAVRQIRAPTEDTAKGGKGPRCESTRIQKEGQAKQEEPTYTRQNAWKVLAGCGVLPPMIVTVRPPGGKREDTATHLIRHPGLGRIHFVSLPLRRGLDSHQLRLAFSRTLIALSVSTRAFCSLFLSTTTSSCSFGSTYHNSK